MPSGPVVVKYHEMYRGPLAFISMMWYSLVCVLLYQTLGRNSLRSKIEKDGRGDTTLAIWHRRHDDWDAVAGFATGEWRCKETTRAGV